MPCAMWGHGFCVRGTVRHEGVPSLRELNLQSVTEQLFCRARKGCSWLWGVCAARRRASCGSRGLGAPCCLAHGWGGVGTWCDGAGPQGGI